MALRAAVQASTRARRIVLLIQLTCIVVFIAFWQSRQSSWPMTRLQTAKMAYTMSAECAGDWMKLHDTNQITTEQWQALVECGGKQGLKEDEARTGVKVVLNWKLSSNQAYDWVHSMQQSIADHVVNTGVPVLGTTLDVNDLGFLGGITFASLLFWLRFSLWREWQNIHTLFERCKREDKEKAKLGEPSAELLNGYELLAMAQVLSVPYMPKREDVEQEDSEEQGQKQKPEEIMPEKPREDARKPPPVSWWKRVGPRLNEAFLRTFRVGPYSSDIFFKGYREWIKTEPPNTGPTTWGPILMLSSPLVIQAAVVVHDGETMGRALALQSWPTMIEFAASVALLAWICWLSWSCCNYYHRVQWEWNKTYSEDLHREDKRRILEQEVL